MKFAEERQARANAIEDIAIQIFLLTNNRAAGDLETQVFAGTLADKLGAIPTDRLSEILNRATTDAAPYPPTAGHMIAAWKQEQVHAPRPTFGEIEQAEIRAGRAVDPSTLTDILPLAVEIHKRIGMCIVCDCEPEKRRHFNGFVDVPWPAKLDPPGPRCYWRCAKGECGFQVDSYDEEAVRAAAVQPFGSGVGSSASETVPTPTATAPQKSRLGMFADECDVDFLALDMAQRKQLQEFCTWCDRQRPPVRANRDNYGQAWNDWQFSLAAEVAA